MTHTQCISLTHTRTRTPPHSCKKQFLLVNLQVLTKKKKALLWNRTLVFSAQNTCTLTPKSSHIVEYIYALEGHYGFSWHLDQQHFSSLLKQKHLPRRPLCVVSVIWVSFACLQVRMIQQKNFLLFSRLDCCISCTASSTAIASLFGDFSIRVYTLQYSRWLTVALFSAYVRHMFWKLWLSISLGLH